MDNFNKYRLYYCKSHQKYCGNKNKYCNILCVNDFKIIKRTLAKSAYKIGYAVGNALNKL